MHHRLSIVKYAILSKKGFLGRMMEHNGTICELLLLYYDDHRRDLPWRTNRTPYGTWISETMLQQTRVAAVIPYYHRFLEMFPDLRALAEAPLDRVYKTWEGLGYYSRAHNLHNGARYVLSNENGVLPSEYERLIRIPGIGPYTAGAIASLAFGKQEPAVDGNVIRVFARLYALRVNAKEEKTKKLIAEKVRLSLPQDRPGDFNEAVMDIGAGICFPRNPSCGDCPLQTVCEAYLLNIAGDLPLRVPKGAVPQMDKTVAVCFLDGKILVRKRPAAGLLANLYEFVVLDGHLTEEMTVHSVCKALGMHEDRLQITVTPLPPSRHVFSHLSWIMEAFRIDIKREKTGSPELVCSECRSDFYLVDREEASRLAFPSALKAYLPEIHR